MKKKQKVKGSFYENLKLRQKMSLILGTLTFFVLLGLLYFLIHSFEITMDKKIDSNMADKSAEASSDLEELMSKLDTIALNIEESISFTHGQNDEVGGIPGNPWKLVEMEGKEYNVPAMNNVTFRSRVVDSLIPASRYNAEVLILNNMYSYMKSEEKLEDIGVLFEPYAFYKNIENSAPLLTRGNVEGRKIVNFLYDSYKEQPYYKEAKEKGEPYVTPVYTDEDTNVRMFALVRPLIWDGNFVGVILLDVNEDILLNISEKDYDEEVDRLVNIGAAAGVATVILFVVVTSLLIAYFLKPLQKVSEAGKKLSAGDFTMDLSYKNNDEIGTLMHAMNDVVNRIRSIISDLSEKLSALAQGNFDMEMNNEEYYSGAYRPLR